MDVRRYDFPKSDALTPGEYKTLRFTARERLPNGTWQPITSFSNFSNIEFYLMDKGGDAGSTQAERRARSVFYVQQSAMTISAPPLIDVPLPAVDTAKVRPGARWYELWADYLGNPTRLAYGWIQFED